MLLCLSLLLQATALADTYTVSGTSLLKNGAPWIGGGVNAFDQFGPSTKSGYPIKMVREIIDDFKECPINTSQGAMGTSIGTLHPLETIVANNRAQGMITILCPFGWDTGSYTQILGNRPSSMPWYAEFKTRLAAVATKFAGQSDVWIDVWNEPYAWDNTGFTEAQWISDMNDLYSTVRNTGNNNILLIPGQAMDGGEGVLVHQGSFLSGKSNVAATIHCYNAWTGNSQATVESRIQSIKGAGWALIFGEVGPDQWVTDCTHVLEASITQLVSTCAWSWDAGDGSRLVNGGTPTTWGNQFLPYLSRYVAPSGPNLALNKAVVVSSIENTNYPGSKAVDGNGATRWASAMSDPQWIYVDLGANYNVNRVKLVWENAYASSYKIQVSANASSWSDIYSTTTGTGGTADLTGLSGTGRYVRMYGTVRGTPYGYSLWSFEVYGTSAGGPIPDGTYKVIARHSGKALDVSANGTANGSNVQQWTYGAANNQRWTLTYLGNNLYKIIGVASGKSLDVSGGSTADGANVQIWDWANVGQQKWTITATSGGYYSVLASHSGKALEVSASSMADGGNVQQWTYGGGNNQQWSFQAP
ncbi:MAG: glycoside hydrolase family 5 [Verrucomicrobiales bacterium]|nr:glycoside hydrolase family 5 [Verrucomicrobiales bacterium]